MYISQPIYPTAKPKMQQSYVMKPGTPVMKPGSLGVTHGTPKNDKTTISPISENKVEEQQVPIESLMEEIVVPLKKLPEVKIEAKPDPIEIIAEEKSVKSSITERVKSKRKKKILVKRAKLIKNGEEEKPKPIEVELVQKPIEQTEEDIPKPVASNDLQQTPAVTIEKGQANVVENIGEDKVKLVEQIPKATSILSNKITEKKPEQVENQIENIIRPLEQLLKEKLPALEDIIVGKPVHIQNKLVLENQLQANLEPLVPEIEEPPKRKKSAAATFGINSSIEKGRKAIAVPKKKNTFTNIHQQIQEQKMLKQKKKLEQDLQVPNTQNHENWEEHRQPRILEQPQDFRQPRIIEQQPEYRQPWIVEQPQPVEYRQPRNIEQLPVFEQLQALRQQPEQVQLQEMEPPQFDIPSVFEELDEAKPKRAKQFKEMTIEEKVEYLVNLPAAVPKMKCEIKTNDLTIQGIIAGYTNGIVHVMQRRKPYRVETKIEDIVAINRKSF